MDKVFLDNTLKAYFFFLISILSGVIISFLFSLIIKLTKKETYRRITGYITGIIMVFAFHIGILFFDKKTMLFQKSFIFLKLFYIIVFTFFIIRILLITVDRVFSLSKFNSNTQMTKQIVGLVNKVIITVIGIMSLSMIMNILGFNVMSIVTGLGIGGLAVALAAQDFLSNILGGITIFISRVFLIDDYVEIAGKEGFVKDIGLRTTTLKMLNGRKVIIPNNQIMNSTIVNYTHGNKTLVNYLIGLTYDTSIEKLKKAIDLIENVLKNDERIPNKNKISVGFYKFDSYSLNLYIGFYIHNDERGAQVKQDFHFKIKEAFDKENIEMAFPTSTIYLENTK